MIINILFNIPAATDPQEVPQIFADAGYRADIPPSGVMPSSATNGGKAIVHAIISGATYQQILDVTTTQRPVWQIFGAQDAFKVNDELTVHEPVNASVWNFLPDRPDGEGGFTPQTELHTFQGSEKWSSKP